MNEEKIGGISYDDIMAAAMDGLDDNPKNNSSVSSGVHNDRESFSNNGKSVDAVPVSRTTFVGSNTVDVGGTQVNTETQNSGTAINSDISGNISNNSFYTIGNCEFVNVTNHLSGIYEQMLINILDYIEANRTAEAMQMAQDLVDHNMSNELAWLVYANAKKAWGDNALAIKGFEQAIAINPRFAMAYNDLGKFYVDNNQFEQAADCFNKALEFEPMNTMYMGNVVLSLAITDSYGAAIEKCQYFIDISEEKTYLQNILGKVYINLSKEYVVDVPDDYQDSNCDTTPGFISLEDITEVRKYCNDAKSLLTLDEFKEDAEMAEMLLQACDEDCQLFPAHKKIFTIFHAVMVFIIYTFITLVWGAPIAIVAAIFTFKADYFPGYVYNYVWCTGSDDPLKYSRDSFYRNHDLLKAMADGAKDGWNSTDSSTSDSLWWELLKGLFKGQVWFLKARWQFYKRYIQQRKEQKKNSIGTVKTDDIQPQA